MLTMAVVGVGDMGSAVGAVLVRHGYRVVTDLTGRSAHSRRLAAGAQLEDLRSLDALIAEADIILSILPPAVAVEFARAVATSIEASASSPLFVECNAVAPHTVQAIQSLFAGSGAAFLDVGIVGPPPRSDRKLPTRFYVSGDGRDRLLELGVPELRLIDMGDEIGRASAIKMTYAAMNKATDALYTTVLMAAEQLGVRQELVAEFESSQPAAAQRMANRIPFLAATAERYVGEMQEIAATFERARVTPMFHRGSEWLFEQLARTSLAEETRADLPAHRSLDEALAAFTAILSK